MQLTTWSGWSSCSRTCGAGEMTRSRTCLSGCDQLTGDLDQSQSCNLRDCLPYFELTGPLLPRRSNYVGQITSYFNNFEFSLEVKYRSIKSGYFQLVNVYSKAKPSDAHSLLYLYPKLDENKLLINFWGSLFAYPYIQIERSQYFQWHKERIAIRLKMQTILLIWQFSYKIQMIQSTSDNLICKQEVLVNQISIWSATLSCPARKTETQNIYLHGDDNRTPDAEIRNVKFYTNSL